ncbi:MAG: hypothetical protein ACREH4_08180 [Vitreimonas sp.]
MSDADALHNKLAGEIVRRIVEPTIEAGGDRTSILVLTESVVTGVVEFCARNDNVSREVVLDALIDGVRERLTDIAARP